MTLGLTQFDYTLNAAGVRTAKNTREEVSNRNESYGYDAIDQVAGVDYGAGLSAAYTYDARGNLAKVGK